MKKELIVQVFLIIGGLMIVLFAWYFLQTDDPVLVQDPGLAGWLDESERAAAREAEDIDPLVRMAPLPGTETVF